MSSSARFAPGQALRLDPLPGHMPGGAGQAWRMTYSSLDARSTRQNVRVSAQVLLPPGRPPAGGWPVLAWAHGATGIGLTCAPSVMGIGLDEEKFFNEWLHRGYAIVATDYPGLGEPGPPLFLNARSEGMSVLDAIRAAGHRVPGLSAVTVLYGHSQGAQAVLAAAALASQYAPSLHVRGVMAAAPPFLDETGMQARLHPRSSQTFDPALPLLIALAQSADEAGPSFRIQRALTERARVEERQAASVCFADWQPALRKSGLTSPTAFTPEAERAFVALAPRWTAYPSLAVSVPVLIGTGTTDTHNAPEEQDRLVRALCAGGSSVQQIRYAGVGHNATLRAMDPAAQAFARRVLEGGDVPRHACPAP